MRSGRDHGGGLDAAMARFGGTRADWVDLSTGINPVPYPLPEISADAWAALPDQKAEDQLIDAARRFWNVTDDLSLLAAPGASSLIAQLPCLIPQGSKRVHIPTPTYNEHAAGFAAHGWNKVNDTPDVRVIVHPNNPTGHWYGALDLDAPFTVIDESFADVAPERSMIGHANNSTIILKSFGKFWGLAGLRLGFAIGPSDLIERLSERLGPWAVSGPALRIATAALTDHGWATETRARLNDDAARLDNLMTKAGAELEGGISLFRLYRVDNATAWQERLAAHHVWSRIFPYSEHYLRLGLPTPQEWAQLETAL
ncbi:Histidinol-phosphate aminotransferase 2 [Roseovarius albus]|uniref:Aminotransferase n=1 Tax=Roseovarius albus TaxID=1247867 RepID=A0A1X7AAD6_9RHOB|nr:threonine-phosphate decarboxylase [Roseovarius albus]SLN72804.1 Histidinol-phosphate aminotransferase 2 [Roseovarius albus]